jgi:ABC-2 type transport system ATP-binding protein
MMSHAITLKNVTKRFRGQTALDDVSLDVPAGVVFALLGENGAGKTTAIRIMLGLVEPDAGEAHVLGLDSRRDGLRIRRRVGYVPERPTLYEWMTTEEIGWFTAGFYPPGFEFRYRKLFEAFRVPIGRKMCELSKGMRAKVVLSLAMAHEPELLILDEPTSGLDAMVRLEFLQSMVDIAAQGRTVLVSSHQIHEVERVADMVAIVRASKVLACESLDALKRSTVELTITSKAPLVTSPAVAGRVLASRQRGNQWQIVVRDLEAPEIDRLESQSNVLAVDSRTPSLEEIFVAYMAAPETAPPHVPAQSVEEAAR